MEGSKRLECSRSRGEQEPQAIIMGKTCLHVLECLKARKAEVDTVAAAYC